MRAAIVTEAGKPLELVNDVELGAPRAGEVRVRVTTAGSATRTSPDATPAAPADRARPRGGRRGRGGGRGRHGLAVGDKVVLTPCPPCGTCYWCVRNEASHCVSARSAC